MFEIFLFIHLQALAQPLLKSSPLSAELRTTVPLAAPALPLAAPALALPTTKLLPITYETKPLYRFAAPALAPLAPAPALLAGNSKRLFFS